MINYSDNDGYTWGASLINNSYGDVYTYAYNMVLNNPFNT